MSRSFSFISTDHEYTTPTDDAEEVKHFTCFSRLCGYQISSASMGAIYSPFDFSMARLRAAATPAIDCWNKLTRLLFEQKI